MVLKDPLRDAQDSPDCISQNPSQHGAGYGRLLLYALPKMMNIKPDKKSESLFKEMLRKNSQYSPVDLILNVAVEKFSASER